MTDIEDFNSPYWLTLGALRDKAIKEAERRELRQIEEHEQGIKDQIKKHLKFTKKYVRKARSRQDGSCHAFFDIVLDKDSVNKAMNTMYDTQTCNKISRCDKARGRTYAISAYASYVQNLERHSYICKYVLSAINEAYRKFVNDLLDSEYELDAADDNWEIHTYKCKSWPISWFNEVFISDEKFKTSAETFIEELEEQYHEWPKLPKDIPEPTDREKAWIDRYIDFDTTEEFIMHCHDIMESPDIYAGLKNYRDYIDEAQKILGRRL
jgi:hypothetical protein